MIGNLYLVGSTVTYTCDQTGYVLDPADLAYLCDGDTEQFIVTYGEPTSKGGQVNIVSGDEQRCLGVFESECYFGWKHTLANFSYIFQICIYICIFKRFVVYYCTRHA